MNFQMLPHSPGQIPDICSTANPIGRSCSNDYPLLHRSGVWSLLFLVWLACSSASNARADETDFFDPQPVSEEITAIRKAFFEGNLPLAEKLLRDSGANDSAAQALDLGIRIARTEAVDPLSEVLHNNDFIGADVGAFIANGKEHPAEVIAREIRTMTAIDAKAGPHVADAICLAIALQLSVAVKEGSYIALNDDILFSKQNTTAPQEMFVTMFREVLCSDPLARKGQDTPERAAYHNLISRTENAPYMRSGIWTQVKGLASKADAASQERWRPVYLDLARKCAENARYTSATLIVVQGAHLGQEGGWRFLREAAEAQQANPVPRHVTNLKIAFAYFNEALASLKIDRDEQNVDFQNTRDILATLGDRKETTYAFEAAGLKPLPEQPAE